MKLKISLYTRFMFWTILLLCILFGALLFIIQRREIRTLYEETQSRALLLAQYLADTNFQSIMVYDRDAIASNLEDRVDDDLPYIVLYDRQGIPLISTEWVTSYPQIIGVSHFISDVTRESRYIQSKRIEIEERWTRVLEVEIPIFTGEEETGEEERRWASIKIGHSLEPMYAEIKEIKLVLLLVGIGGLALGIFGATFLAKRITRPLKKLVDGTVRISKGDFSSRIDIPSKDEIGDLAGSFNSMTIELLQTRERMAEANRKLVQVEKLASIGRLAATIAHEIRNPLTSVKLNIQKLEEGENLEELEREHLGLSLEGIDQIEKFVKELLNFTRVPELNLERFTLDQVMDESLKVLRDVLVQKKVALEKTYEKDLPTVLIDGDKVRQVFLNILRNASEAVSTAGIIQISIQKCSDNVKPHVEVLISDNGSGIPESDWDDIFEPFFTTKPSGFGLGLANARKIVEQHNGSIKVVKKEGKGSSFLVTIPCEEEQ